MQAIELTFNEKTALGFAKRAAEAKTINDGAWFMKQANRHADKAGLTLEQIEEKAAAIEAAANAPQIEAEAAPVAKCSVKAIRRFFAICKSAGIDASNDDRVRGALSVFFGVRIESRKQLTTDQWISAGDAIEAKRLVF